jgi:hypothetical protein
MLLVLQGELLQPEVCCKQLPDLKSSGALCSTSNTCMPVRAVATGLRGMLNPKTSWCESSMQVANDRSP